MTTLLPASLDTAAASPLRLELRTLVDAHEPVMLDGSAVERIGQACLQVLAAAQIAATAAGLAFAIDMPSPPLTEMAGLAGLATLLPVQG